MKKYLESSLTKFKSDFLSKIIYDSFKWAFCIIILISFLNYIPTLEDIRLFLNKDFKISFFGAINSIIIIFICSLLIINYIYKAKLKRIEKSLLIDDMTGLYNRKALINDFNLNIEKRLKFSVIIIDIDDFKNFNTNNNYLFGDKVISKIGHLLSRDNRITDKAYRQYNKADEFIILAIDTNLEGAFLAAERKRKNIEATYFDINEQKINLTVSCVVTEFQNEDTFESIVDRLSKGLKEAKLKKGKNNSVKIQ